MLTQGYITRRNHSSPPQIVNQQKPYNPSRLVDATACIARARRFSLRTMRLLDRYVLRELLLPFGYCLGGFLIFWVSSDLFKEMGKFQENKLTMLEIFEYYVATSPEILSVVIPVAFLLALLYALTQHSRHNEITAMRAAGLSLWRIAASYFVIGAIASVALLVINELWAPDSEARAEFILKRHSGGSKKFDQSVVHGLGLYNAGENRHWVNGVYNFTTGEMLSPLVIWTKASGTKVLIAASRATRTNNVWVFFDVQQFELWPVAGSGFVPTLQTNQLAFPEFSETAEQIRSEIRITRNLTLKDRYRADVPITYIVDYLRLHPNVS